MNNNWKIVCILLEETMFSLLLQPVFLLRIIHSCSLPTNNFFFVQYYFLQAGSPDDWEWKHLDQQVPGQRLGRGNILLVKLGPAFLMHECPHPRVNRSQKRALQLPWKIHKYFLEFVSTDGASKTELGIPWKVDSLIEQAICMISSSKTSAFLR